MFPGGLPWRMAVRNRPVTQSLLFHSDRGVQYACQQFRNQLKGKPVLQSIGTVLKVKLFI
jgi:putative transposase